MLYCVKQLSLLEISRKMSIVHANYQCLCDATVSLKEAGEVFLAI